VGFGEGRKESDSDNGRLNGLGNTDEGAELVLKARRALDDDWRYWFVGQVVTGRNGNNGLFGVGRRFGNQLDGSGSEVNVVAVFHDSKFANQGFGVNAQQSVASGLNQTKLNGGLRSFGINYFYRYNINHNWQIFGEVLYERFSSHIQSSPIARKSYEAEVGAGLLHRF